MNLSRRGLLASLIALPVAVRLRAETQTEDQPPKQLIGSWFVASGRMSMVFSLEPSGEALVVFSENGALSIGRHSWKAMPNGVLINTLPRFRLWESTGPCEVRGEMEEMPPGFEMSEGFRHFPLRFCLKRIVHARFPRELAERPLPGSWDNSAVGDDWDQTAGKRR
jgi:hypothetical protein